MTFDRREVLGALGVASGSTLLWALGCGGTTPAPRRAPQVSGEIRTWLHDAVARLAAVYPSVHALAVSRRRTVAAADVASASTGRERHDAVVLTVRDRDGRHAEYVSSELTADGVAAAAAALGASGQRARVELGPDPTVPAEPPALDDADLQGRVAALQRDLNPSSRIIYRAALIDHDDAIVWSVAPGRDLIQRLIRVRQSATRAAWNGARPGLGEVERAWAGGLDAPASLTPADVEAATTTALELMTPGSFDDGERTVVLAPDVAAALIDAIANCMLGAATIATATADHAALANTANARNNPPQTDIVASALVTVIDDPTAPGAYGSFAFDDEGSPAAPLTLLDAGRPAARLTDRGGGRGRRPGHTAPVQPAASHLQLVPGALPLTALYTDGLVLEGSLGAFVIPSSIPSRSGPLVRLPCARARELRAGNTTGRVYADVELVAPLSQLLGAIDAIASAPSSFIPRGSSGALGPSAPLWRSISSPALRTRGLVRVRRR